MRLSLSRFETVKLWERGFLTRREPLLIVSASEAKHKTSRVSEIVLVGVCELVCESGQQVVNLCRPERDHLAHRNIHASPKGHGERILCWRSLERASPSDRLANLFERISVHIAVCCTEQKVPKRVESVSADFDLRTKQIREQVAGNFTAGTPRKL